MKIKSVLLVATLAATQAFAGGTFTDLSTIDGRETHVLATNAAGVAVGYYVGDDGLHHAFKYENSQFSDVVPLVFQSQATAVNEQGHVVGTIDALHGMLGHKRPFRVIDGVFETFSPTVCEACNITPLSINEADDFVGRIDLFPWTQTDGKVSHAFLSCCNGVFTDLNILQPTLIEASRIDDLGNVYGTWKVNGGIHAFMFQSGTR